MTPSQAVDKILPAMCRDESMDLLSIDLEIDGDQYQFLIDTGASVSVIKPGIGEGKRTNPIEFTVRGITGTEIETNGSRMLEFRLGRRIYQHRFVIASVQMEYSGILGLDALRSLQARIDLVDNHMLVGHDQFPFVKVRLRSHYSQGACKTEKVASNDGPGQSVRSERNSRRTLPAPTSPEFEDFTNPDLSAQTTQEGRTRLREVAREGGVQAVLACCTTIPPRSMAIVKTNLVTEGRERMRKLEFPESVVLEPEEIYVKGVYSGRALSEVNSSSEIRHSGRQEVTRSGVIKLIDNEENRVGDGGNPRIVLAIPGYSVDERRSYRKVVMRNALVKVDRCNPRTRERCKVRQGQAMQQGECLSKSVEPDKIAELQLELSRQYASCLLPVINTSAEEIRLPAGMRVATVEIQWKVAEPSETVNNCGINGVGRYPKQLDPQVREQNRRVPKLLEEKLQHLSPEDQTILKPALLKYQDLFKKTENGSGDGKRD